MKEIRLVTASDLTTIEDYIVSLITGISSLKTLEAYQITAHNKGLLDEDEAEVGTSICWEIQRLVALYKEQVKNLLDRSSFDEEEILKELNELLKKL